MHSLFAVAIEMGAAGWAVTAISVIGFVVMFGLASAKGEYQSLIKIRIKEFFHSFGLKM